MRPRVKAVWPGARLAAPAYPVRCTPGDNLAVHVAVTTAPAGSVLAVDVGDEAEFGYWGEVLTTARADAGHRRVGHRRGRARHRRPRGPRLPGVLHHRRPAGRATRRAAGAVGRPVDVGGVPCRPATCVVGDGDGVVVVPVGQRGRRARHAARAREEKERGLFGPCRRGRPRSSSSTSTPGPSRAAERRSGGDGVLGRRPARTSHDACARRPAPSAPGWPCWRCRCGGGAPCGGRDSSRGCTWGSPS